MEGAPNFDSASGMERRPLARHRPPTSNHPGCQSGIGPRHKSHVTGCIVRFSPIWSDLVRFGHIFAFSLTFLRFLKPPQMGYARLETIRVRHDTACAYRS